MTTIKVAVNDQDLTIVQKPIVASGDFGSVALHADFDSSWDGYSKTAVFYKSKDAVFHVMMDGNNECVIPWEVLQSAGMMYLGIFAIKDERRKTTKVVRYDIKPGAWNEDIAIHDPTPDVYNQILSAYATVNANAESAKAQAANAEEAAKQAASTASNAQNAAEQANENVNSHSSDTNNPHGVTAEQIGARPNTWTPTAEEVGARPDTWMPTASDVGAVPTTRTVNGKALTSDITLTASDVGAAPSSHGTHVSYGTSASALGTSSAGSATTVSRSDHVHALPALTSCTGTLSIAKGGTGATTAAAALTAFGGVSYTKLWTNASPTSAFAKQTVTVSTITSYDACLIVYRTHTSSQNNLSWMMLVGSGCIAYFSDTEFHLYRSVDYASGKFTFNTAYKTTMTTHSETTDNGYLIPYAIYGIKGVAK